MRVPLRHIQLNILLILALMLSGISPACQFISGHSSLIEICTPYGLQKIAVPAEQPPAHDKNGHQTDAPCAFCFSQSNIKTVAAVDGNIPVLREMPHNREIVSAETGQYRLASLSFQARGPPILL